MSIMTMVYDRLTGHAGTSALISTRCYPVLLPQVPTYPALSYQRAGGAGLMGSSNVREVRYQVDCWDETMAGADALATQVKAALEEHSAISGTFDIKLGRVVNQLDDYDDQADVYRVSMDVMFVTTGD